MQSSRYGESMAEASLQVTVNAIIDAARNIKVFELVRPDGGRLPFFTAGAHIDVETPAGVLRQYSLCNDPRDDRCYRIAVLREATSRGGSASMHDRVRNGDRLTISRPRNHFPLDEEADRHLLIAGGIGITPLIAMVHRLLRTGADFHLHYCARDTEAAAFYGELRRPELADKVTFHFDGGDPRQGLDVTALLAEPEKNVHLYCCGPAGLMAAVGEAASTWPAGQLHFEHFSGDPEQLAQENSAFEVEIASTGAVYTVPPEKSILSVLRDNGLEIDSSCEEGICGTCITGLLAGEADHRDMILSEAEKSANRQITVCCSRARSGRLRLDL